jgi:hypothetical protein
MSVNLDKLSEEELLSLRLCNLTLAIEGTWLQGCVNELYKELKDKGLQFTPECYLADEWLAPDKEPVIGIPFFLAHPSLMKLERKMMMDVEGGTKDWCMKLLRHEAGHAVNYAYQLYRRKKWREVFGFFSQEYEDTYRFRPYSRNFVKHLEDYYAQYHPDEDFAETFAVWLTPKLNWKKRYKGWKALQKIQYVDEVMNKVKDKEPVITKGKKSWQASKLRSTLRSYYKKKRHFWAEDFPDFHDSNLKRMFIQDEEKSAELPLVYKVIRKYRKHIRNAVSAWTGEKKYFIDDLMETLIERSKHLHLHTQEDESISVLKISTYITTSIMNDLYTGSFRGDG